MNRIWATFQKHPDLAIPWIMPSDFHLAVGLPESTTRLWFSLSQATTLLLIVSLVFIEILFLEKYLNFYLLMVVAIGLSIFLRKLVFWCLWSIFKKDKVLP